MNNGFIVGIYKDKCLLIKNYKSCPKVYQNKNSYLLLKKKEYNSFS